MNPPQLLRIQQVFLDPGPVKFEGPNDPQPNGKSLRMVKTTIEWIRQNTVPLLEICEWMNMDTF